MKLNSLTKQSKRKHKKRVGRGISAGQGKTCGRVTKGQKSRTGYKIPKHFEGGQTPFTRRLPKSKGAASHKKIAQVVGLDKLEKNFSDGEKITKKKLLLKGLINNVHSPIKILANGKITKNFIISCINTSKNAKNIIEKNR